jgi:L-threonylcarbamoyladenylate synthase
MAWASQFRLRLARRHVRRGGILAYPTEAVFGLGCDPLNPLAVARLLAMKGRLAGKGLIVIASEFSQVADFLKPLDPAWERKVLDSWPGPVTWLLPVRKSVPTWITGAHDTVAVRITSHPLCSRLCQALGGALISTSANPSNAKPARTRLKVRKYFRGSDIAFLPGSLGDQSRPTAIFDAVTGRQYR